MELNPIALDRKAADEEFLSKIDEYTLADANGRAPAWISQKLRSDQFVTDWNTALTKLRARTPAGEFSNKLQHIKAEANRAEKTARMRHHVEAIEKGREVKYDITKTRPINVAQIAGALLQSYIIAGKHSENNSMISVAISEACKLLKECERL